MLLSLALPGLAVAEEARFPTPSEPGAPIGAPHLSERARVKVPKDFSTHDGGWVTFRYHPSLSRRVEALIAEAEPTRKQLAAWLGAAPAEKVEVLVARTPGQMESLAPEGAPYPEYASGVAYSQLGLILLTAEPLEAGQAHDLAEIFRHELAHVALYQATQGRPVPRWFNEGFAVFASGESSWLRLHTLWVSTVSDQLIPLSNLERNFPAGGAKVSVAYAQAADFVRFMVRRQDRHRFTALIEHMNQGHTFDAAVQASYGESLSRLETEWRDDVAQRYTIWPMVFGGSFVWVGLTGLFFWAYRKRRQRNKATLTRWAKEEALQDEMERLKQVPRVHIVLAPTPGHEPKPFTPPNKESGVPKVQHDGNWHTLH